MASFMSLAPSMRQARITSTLHYTTSWLAGSGLLSAMDFLAMDASTVILLTPAAIFVAGGIIWFWTNKL
jgi:hypothetical protein